MKEISENELFEIGIEHLRDVEVFPFHLYVYNPSKKSFHLYLDANTPLTEQKLTFIQYILQRKGRLAISNKQKLTFLEHMDFSEADIPSLMTEEVQEQEEIKTKANIVIDFDFEDEFIEADKLNDHMRLIQAMREEVLGLSQKISHTVSLARYFVEHLATEDNLINRTVALSYFLTKESKITDSKSLADIVVAAYLYHLGYTQMDMKLSSSPQLLMGDRMAHEHKKHLGLSQHLIKKSGIDISMRCKKIINEHHERTNGDGYPNSKTKYQIEPLALILGCASHLIEYSMGKIDGREQMILPLIKLLEKGDRKPGLEVDFGESLMENLISIVKSEFKEEAA
ncbi:MAG: hypothetical protein CME70_23815 [Halobacteriovorax sp.]|nr:hypothetical protein [Halobacteriovorax sp.]|tara:strand:+ start:71476 stop:72495 length:1020 start_codon:yes stop_codon:yes gene_type:complete